MPHNHPTFTKSDIDAWIEWLNGPPVIMLPPNTRLVVKGDPPKTTGFDFNPMVNRGDAPT